MKDFHADDVRGRPKQGREAGGPKWRTVLILILSAMGLSAAIGAQLAPEPLPAKVTEAGRLLLRDKLGRVRGLLDVAEGDLPTLVFFDAKGSERLRVGMAENGEPALWLSDKDGKPRLTMGVRPDASVGLDIVDQKGRRRAVLSGHPSGRVSLDFRDTSDRTRLSVGVGVGEGEDQYLAFYSRDGKLRFGLNGAGDDKFGFSIWDSMGSFRVGLGISKTSGPGLIVIDGNGKVLFQTSGFKP